MWDGSHCSTPGLSDSLPPKAPKLVGIEEWARGTAAPHSMSWTPGLGVPSGSRTGDHQPIPEADPMEGPQHLTAELKTRRKWVRKERCPLGWDFQILNSTWMSKRKGSSSGAHSISELRVSACLLPTSVPLPGLEGTLVLQALPRPLESQNLGNRTALPMATSICPQLCHHLGCRADTTCSGRSAPILMAEIPHFSLPASSYPKPSP